MSVVDVDEEGDSEASLSLWLGADRSLLDCLIAPADNQQAHRHDFADGGAGLAHSADHLTSADTQRRREEQVRVFVKQLLTALQYMHNRNIAHLDLRPEAILLRDDHLILADFGQSRHLLRGKANGAIKSTPEFVAPEIVAGTTVTLSSDMWSAGVLTYVLLAGMSPFLGDNDRETFANVIAGRYRVEIPEMAHISPEAKDFLARLILLDPYKRMSVDEALNHDWILDPALRDAKLSTDCLREFKYRGNWLERRVFVQQTPSDELTQYIEAPVPKMSATSESAAPANAAAQIAEPRAMYDYLKIKDAAKPLDAPPIPAKTQKSSPSQQIQLTPAQQQQILAQFPPWLLAQLPAGVRPEQLLAWAANPRQLAAALQLVPPGAPSPGRDSSHSPSSRGSSAERRRLQPQSKGETPSNKPTATPAGQPTILQQALPKLPLHMIRGERRAIEEEIANRILSDISEENSVAESLLSVEELGELQRMRSEDLARWRQQRRAGSISPSITPQHVDASSETTTPLALSPAFTAESGGGAFFADQELHKPAYGADTHPDDLLRQFETPSPGFKSSVQLSPSQERAMNVIIASGRGREGEEPPHGRADSFAPIGTAQRAPPPGVERLLTYGTGAGGRQPPKVTDDAEWKKRYRPPPDTEYDLLMGEVDRIKRGIKNEKAMMDELEKYRPKNVYKEEDLEPKRPDLDLDSYGWESDYQIGPDTLLLATRGAAFNARVRDYRRELLGDSAPYVQFGWLGERNADITVRERRRFTDLIKEDPIIAKSVAAASGGGVTHLPAARLISSDVPSTTVNGQADGKSDAESTVAPASESAEERCAPTFRSRMRDACFRDGVAQISFSCRVVGNPQPDVSFFHHESALTDGGRYKIQRQGDVCSLTIARPLQTDAGQYSCIVSNELGSDRCSCSALCGEGIGRPSRPDVELSSDTEVLLRWDPPERLPTTMEGVVYRVECRPAGESDAFAKWNVISNRVESECAVVKHLVPHGIYQFRITARNGFGWGDPGITSRIIRTHPRGVPKLNMEALRQEMKLAVITLPQRSTRRGTGLSEIMEELEEAEEGDENEPTASAAAVAPHEEGVDDDAASVGGGSEAESVASVASSTTRLERMALNVSEDPLKRFQLESELFRGEFSVIRYAVEAKSGRHCAAKIRASARTNGGGAPPREDDDALLEYRTLASAQHENVVRLISAYNSNNFLLLFTERLHENVFDRFAYPDSFTEEQVAFTIRQLAAALHWIHYKGVMHLDVEPSNVMFASKRSWLLKLIDFGRAQMWNVGGKATAPQRGQRSAAAEWSAPETLNAQSTKSRAYESNLRLFDAMLAGNGGNGKSAGLPRGLVNGTTAKPVTESKKSTAVEESPGVSPQTDVWGLGLITFCLLGGFHPFAADDDSEAEVAENVLRTKCDPNLIPVQASEEALRFVTWALKKEPKRRMTTGEALAHRFLACDPAMLRRRENIRYSSTRLRRTYDRMLRRRQLNSASHNQQNGENGRGPRRAAELNRTSSGSRMPNAAAAAQSRPFKPSGGAVRV